MKNKLIILKSSWGIVIDYEIEELYDFNSNETNLIKVTREVFISLYKIKLNPEGFYYFIEGVKKMLPHFENKRICFKINKLDYNPFDFQVEGMFYVFPKWYCENHNLLPEKINVFFDKESNKYVFPELG